MQGLRYGDLGIAARARQSARLGETLRSGQQPAARSVIRKNVPDIRLQNPASTVAIITNSKRRRSIRAPRKRVAHDDEGRGENQERHRGKRLRRHALLQQPETRRPLHHRLISAGQRAGERKADAQGEQGIQRIRRHRNTSATQQRTAPCFAKLAGRRHSILKERLTAAAGTAFAHGCGARLPRNHAEIPLPHGIFAGDSARPAALDRCFFMTLLSTAQHIARDTRKDPRSHMFLIMRGGDGRRRRDCAGRLFAVADLGRRPALRRGCRSASARRCSTCRHRRSAEDPAPLRSAGTRRSQLHLPLARSARAPKHVSADTVEEKVQPIDRIFLSISAHHDTLAPETRVRTIYPRYLEQASRRSMTD